MDLDLEMGTEMGSGIVTICSPTTSYRTREMEITEHQIYTDFTCGGLRKIVISQWTSTSISRAVFQTPELIVLENQRF